MSAGAVEVRGTVEFDQEVAALRDDDDGGYGDGWYCVQTAPWPCPAPSCPFTAGFLTAAHLIVVWPSLDDRSLLAQARNARVAGRDPRIVEYRRDFGRCIPFDVWRRIGGPVHAFAAEPAGWADQTGRRL